MWTNTHHQFVLLLFRNTRQVSCRRFCHQLFHETAFQLASVAILCFIQKNGWRQTCAVNIGKCSTRRSPRWILNSICIQFRSTVHQSKHPARSSPVTLHQLRSQMICLLFGRRSYTSTAKFWPPAKKQEKDHEVQKRETHRCCVRTILNKNIPWNYQYRHKATLHFLQMRSSIHRKVVPPARLGALDEFQPGPNPEGECHVQRTAQSALSCRRFVDKCRSKSAHSRTYTQAT